MKTQPASLVRSAALLAALILSPVFASARAASADRAAELLAQRGSVAIDAAGAHVAPGTFRIQVAAKLGRADATLADGTWLYHDRAIEGSAARGTLVVRFTNGRVSSLAVVTPAVVAALRAAPVNAPARKVLAAR